MRSFTVVMYHYVRPISASKYPRIRGLELADFEGQLEYIEQHYSVISLATLLAAKESGAPLPPRSLLLTFDDGYIDHHRYVAPALARRKLTGLFFPTASAVIARKILDVNKVHFILATATDTDTLIAHIESAVESCRPECDLLSLAEYRANLWQPSRFDSANIIYIKRMLQVALPLTLRSRIVDELFSLFVTKDEEGFADELYLSEEDIRSMVGHGMEIGSHGYDHRWLDRLTESEQADDIDRSLSMLKRAGVDTKRFSFCYPYGAYSSATLELLRARHCAAAFTTNVALANIDADFLELPRIDTNDLPKRGDAVSSAREAMA